MTDNAKSETTDVPLFKDSCKRFEPIPNDTIFLEKAHSISA